jgi:hypothetical protein
MADPNVVNIKGLPRIEEIVNGNLLIVENEQGTNTLDFVNFVIGPNNTSFFNQIINLSASVVSLSATTTSLINSLSATTTSLINSLCATTNAQIQSLSSTVDTKLLNVSAIYYTTGTVIISTGYNISDLASVIKPSSNLDISANDFTLVLGSSASGYPILYMNDNDVINIGNVINFYVRTTNIVQTSSISIRYRILKPYSV